MLLNLINCWGVGGLVADTRREMSFHLKFASQNFMTKNFMFLYLCFSDKTHNNACKYGSVWSHDEGVRCNFFRTKCCFLYKIPSNMKIILVCDITCFVVGRREKRLRGWKVEKMKGWILKLDIFGVEPFLRLDHFWTKFFFEVRSFLN
jgi:hypothetical protein